jgi:hypothetical protein
VSLGTRSFSIAAGRRQAVTVKIARRGFGLIVRSKRVPARARISYRQPDGGSTTITRTISLVAPRHTTR